MAAINYRIAGTVSNDKLSKVVNIMNDHLVEGRVIITRTKKDRRKLKRHKAGEIKTLGKGYGAYRYVQMIIPVSNSEELHKAAIVHDAVERHFFRDDSDHINSIAVALRENLR